MTARSDRVLILSSALPRWPPSDAGTRYLQQLCDVLSSSGPLLVVAPDFDGNVGASAPPDLDVGLEVAAPRRRAVNAAARKVYMVLTRIDPTVPYTPFWLALRGRRWHREIGGASTIDLQWPETLPLARSVRRANPKATLIATHHDVLSQRYARWSVDADSVRRRLKWRWASWRARRMECRVSRYVDHHVVFSEKDAVLLTSQGIDGVRVIDPPLALPGADARALAQRPRTVLFVGFLSRPENDEAARWLVERVWPRVVEHVPDAACNIVGTGAGDELRTAAERAANVRLPGFVGDLGAAYAAARVCAVPLHKGAGTKFKTIEALAAGLPVVSTTIGAEGVGSEETFLRVTDDPDAFAEALVEGLVGPDQARADANQAWAVGRFGVDRFADTVAALYGGHLGS